MDSDTIIVTLGTVLFLVGVPVFLNSFARLEKIDQESFSIRRMVWGTVNLNWDQVKFAHTTKLTSALLRLEIGHQGLLGIYTSYFIILSWNPSVSGEFLSQLDSRGLMDDPHW